MSEIKLPDGGTVRRTPEMLREDIERHKQKAAENLILIGYDLIEAKAQLEHGKWLDFLGSVGFSARTATNYMRLANAVGDNPQLAELPYSKALALIEAPEDMRARMLEDGVDDKSAAEIRRLTKERDQALSTNQLQVDKLKDMRAKLDRAAENEKQLKKLKEYHEAVADEMKKKMEEMKKHPQTVEVQVAPEDYDDLKSAVETLRQQLADAEAAVDEAEQRAAGAIAAAPQEDSKADRLNVIDFVGACNDFMHRVQFYPYHKDELASMDDVSRRRMEIFAHGINKWALRMLGALAEAGGAVDCEGAVGGV